MKKIFTSILLALAITAGANATNYYVDGSKADDTGNGQSWATAKKTITAGGALGVAGDNIFIKTGTYSFSQATSGSSCLATVANKNYYGGFVGTESSISERATSDLDGNGIVEPWEFTNATNINLTATNNAYGLYFNTNTSLRYFDGFTLTGSTSAISITGTATTYANSFIKLNNYINFQNNIISGVTFSEAMSTSGSFGGSVQGGIIGVIGQAGTINNCLIEKNNVTIIATGTQNDNSISPLVFLTSAGTTGRNVCSNIVIRNNQVSIDCSGVTSMTYNNQRGMLLALTGGSNSTNANAVKNVIIHNNTVLFTPKTGSAANTNLGNGALLYVYNPGTSGYKDSIVNCTVANNKMTRVGFAMRIGYSSAATQYTHIAANNVGFNNYNYKDDGTYVIQNFVCYNTGTNAANLIANNICNGGVSITAATGVTVNNLTDLANTNTGSKAPYFSSPTTVIGYTNDGTVETSRWTIETGSYLTAKGLSTANKYDKASISFATTPTVGAYETKTTPTITWSQDFTLLHPTQIGQTRTLDATSNSTSTISYLSDNPSVVSISGNTMTIVGIGHATVTASLTASPYYNAATNVTSNVIVDYFTTVEKTKSAIICFAVGNQIEVRGLTIGEDVTVFGIAGNVIATQKSTQSNLSIAVPRGIYFVRSTNNVKKVLVK